jgi:hypothetical protein
LATGKICSVGKICDLWDTLPGRGLSLKGGAWWYAM